MRGLGLTAHTAQAPRAPALPGSRWPDGLRFGTPLPGRLPSTTTGLCCRASPLCGRRRVVRDRGPRRSQNTGRTMEESFRVTLKIWDKSKLFHSRR